MRTAARQRQEEACLMMLRLRNWIETHGTLSTFMLEVLAVFIGITASLLVDDWRSEREEAATLRHLLEEIHHNAMNDLGNLRIGREYNEMSIGSALSLLYEDVEAMPDDELLLHVFGATWQTTQSYQHTGYSRLMNTPLSIEFERTLSELDAAFTNIKWGYETIARSNDQVLDASSKARRLGGLIVDPLMVAGDTATPETGYMLNELRDLVSDEDGFLAAGDNAIQALQLVRNPDFRTLLSEIIDQRLVIASMTISNMDANLQVVRTIRERLPDVRLAVESIGIIGSATAEGWTRSTPLKRVGSNGDVWQAEVALGDGEIKFRADDSWATDWGAPRSQRSSFRSVQTAFHGDPATVFPSGVAEIKGYNIPVQAGRYVVRFNLDTFEYEFVAAK